MGPLRPPGMTSSNGDVSSQISGLREIDARANLIQPLSSRSTRRTFPRSQPYAKRDVSIWKTVDVGIRDVHVRHRLGAERVRARHGGHRRRRPDGGISVPQPLHVDTNRPRLRSGDRHYVDIDLDLGRDLDLVLDLEFDVYLDRIQNSTLTLTLDSDPDLGRDLGLELDLF